MKKSSGITKSILVSGLAALFSLGALNAFAQGGGDMQQKMKGESMQHKMTKGDTNKEVTLEGEVLDLYCYMKHPANGQGPEHAKCAQSCIRKGLPIGFLSDGVVYVIIGKEHESAKDLVVDYAGKKSRLTGTLIDHDGIKAIEIESIEAVTG
jgi:hypothetical protein